MTTKARHIAKSSDQQSNSSSRSVPVIAAPQKEHDSRTELLHIQRKLGNRRVGQLMRSGLLQKKLKIGKPDDRYEQEADSVADKVVNMPSPAATPNIQRQEKEEEKPQAKPITASITPLLQRKEEEEEPQAKLLQRTEKEEEPQTKLIQGKEASSNALPSESEKELAASRGKGTPLPEATASEMGSRFGADFSDVRVHTDSRAASLAGSVNAQAFTLGSDIYFNSGYYNPENHAGKHLLAHELTHTIQQGASTEKQVSPSPTIQRKEATPEESGGEVTEADKAKARAAAAVSKKIAETAKATGKSEVKSSQAAKAAKQKEKTAEKAKKETASANATAKGKLAAEKMKKAGVKTGPEKGKPKKEKKPVKGAGKKGAPKGKDKAPTSPAEDPAFQAVVAKAQETSTQQKEHKPAADEAKAAQDAAVSPPAELAGKAQDKQAGEMEKAETPSFDKAAFKKQLMDRIAAMAPKSTEDADNFKSDGKADSLKGELQGSVASEKETSQGPLQNASATPPDPGGIEPKTEIPLQPEDPGKPPAPINAENAAPKPKGKSEVEAPLQENSKKLDDQMKEADISEKQLANSNEPTFKTALQNKKSAQADAKSGPQQFRNTENGAIAASKAEAVGTSQESLDMMQGDKDLLLEQLTAKKETTKSADELAREKVGKDIDEIYQATKKQVDATLEQLDVDVATAFDKGAEAAKKVFEDYVDAQMTAYKEERYGGWLGWARWIEDMALGMPSEVNSIYTSGRQLYLDKMEAVIDNVVEIVGAGLTKAKAQVAEGKKKIADYVAGLPDNLKEVGQQAAEDIQNKFSELESGIDAKQDALIDTLANKYKENLEAIDAKIEEMKAANKGLVDAALDAVAGVIKTILELKDMLLRVLAKVADTVMLIIKDPIGFLGNLIKGLKMGFDNFVSNILKHLQSGLIGWLTGSLGPMGITLPDDIFSLKGIFSLVMQVLGLTWDYIRSKAVKLLGEPVVKALETGFEIFQILVKEGPIGVWNWIKEQFNDLKAMVIEQIKSMIITQVITAGVKWILGLLNPAGALIKACMMIYDVVMFFFERGKEILTLVEAVTDSVAAIAKGNLAGAAEMVENSLARALPVVIGFLANLLGIGGLAKKVQDIIGKLRARIDKAIDGIIDKAKSAAKKLMGGDKKGATVKADETKEAEEGWWKERSAFKSADGKSHELFYQGKDKSAVAMLTSAGTTTSVKEKAATWKGRASKPDATPGMKGALPLVNQLAAAVGKQADDPQILSLVKSLTNTFGSEAEGDEDLLKLDAPPVKLPRTKEEEKGHLKAAETVVNNQLKKSDETNDLEVMFPAIQKRYQLTEIGFLKTPKGGVKIHLKINPETDIVPSNLILQGRSDVDATPVGFKTNVTWKKKFLGGDTVGMEMKAAPLGPDHPQGSGPGDSQPTLMSQLPTLPGSAPKESLYIKGHLLNDNIGGPGKPDNLYPITADANQQHELEIESKIKEWVNIKRYWVNYSVEVKPVEETLKRPEDPAKANRVEAKFVCKAAVLKSDGNESNLKVSGTIHSNPGERTRNKGTVTGDVPDDVAKDTGSYVPPVSSAKKTCSYKLKEALYLAAKPYYAAGGRQREALQKVTGSSYSVLRLALEQAKGAELAALLSAADKSAFSRMDKDAGSIAANLSININAIFDEKAESLLEKARKYMGELETVAGVETKRDRQTKLNAEAENAIIEATDSTSAKGKRIKDEALALKTAAENLVVEAQANAYLHEAEKALKEMQSLKTSDARKARLPTVEGETDKAIAEAAKLPATRKTSLTAKAHELKNQAQALVTP